MTPPEFALRCEEIVRTMAGHEAHRALDLLTNDVLRELGYGEGVAIFERAVAHWHASGDAYPYPQACPDCKPIRETAFDALAQGYAIPTPASPLAGIGRPAVKVSPGGGATVFNLLHDQEANQ
jgi:hypothetical protein